MISVNDPQGLRLAHLIMEYSTYLAAFPILASCIGLTSFPFAFEGTAANAYLMYLASRFYRDRTNGNAKKLFLCTLWYLPLLLTGFVVHSRMWNQEKEEENVMEEVIGGGTGGDDSYSSENSVNNDGSSGCVVEIEKKTDIGGIGSVS